MSNAFEEKNRDTSKRRKPITISQQILDVGKMPPQAVDLEEAVLGALMLEKEALTNVIDILQPEAFYKDAHVRIYTAIQNLFKKSEAVDILTVTQELKKLGELDLAGGALYISQLTNRVASSANVESHARIIAQKHIQRELIRISSETIRDAYDETMDVFDMLDNAEKGLYSVVEGNIRKSYDKMSTLIHKAIEQIDIARTQESGISGVPSGFTALDRATSGWQKSDLVIMAARPGMGKTALVLNLCRNAAIQFTRPVALFSLEMSSIQLVNRLIAMESGIDSEKLKKGTIADHEYQQLHARIAQLSDAPIFIDDTPALSIFELRAKARRLKEKSNIEMIIIDYLQLMTAGNDNRGNREQEISTISRSLKALAKELEIPIIALSQLSRAVETRGGVKRPMLSDLRESGAIEQDADMVIFIYRPEYYEITEDEEGNSTSGLTEIDIAKHRHGAAQRVKLRFIKNQGKFTDWDSFDSFDAGAGLEPSGDFNAPSKTITRGSRMNDIEEDGAPF